MGNLKQNIQTLYSYFNDEIIQDEKVLKILEDLGIGNITVSEFKSKFGDDLSKRKILELIKNDATKYENQIGRCDFNKYKSIENHPKKDMGIDYYNEEEK